MNKLIAISLIWVSFGVRITTILPELDDLCYSITVSLVCAMAFIAIKEKHPNLAIIPSILALPVVISDITVLYLTNKLNPYHFYEAKEIADLAGNFITLFGLTVILIKIVIYSYGTTRNI